MGKEEELFIQQHGEFFNDDELTNLDVDVTNVENIEPFEVLSPTAGKWRCDPRKINVLTKGNRPIPNTVVYITAETISWNPGNGEIYGSACPTSSSGGRFNAYNLHALIIGSGRRYIGCTPMYAMQSSGGIWIAVNDTNYSDNSGEIIIRAGWDT